MAKININLETVTLAELDAFYQDAKRVVRNNNASFATTRIEECKARAMAAIAEAEKIADEYCVQFSFSLEYGMGGTYYPTSTNDDRDWDESNEGWVSSSNSC